MTATPGFGTPQTAERQRIDKWLWFARLFKSRSTAARLADSGRVRVTSVVGGEERVERVTKASHLLRAGDILTFPSGAHIRVLRVVELGRRRGPAAEARTLYEDLKPPVAGGPRARTARPRM